MDPREAEERCQAVTERLAKVDPSEWTQLALSESAKLDPAQRALLLTVVGKQLEVREQAVTQRENASERAGRLPPQSRASLSDKIRKIGFLFGIGGLIVTLIFALLIPSPSPFQYFVFRVIIALGAAGFASSFTGFWKLKIKLGALALAATGGFAAFYVVYRLNPPILIFEAPPELNAEGRR